MFKKIVPSAIAAAVIVSATSIQAQELETITVTTATKSEKNIDGVAASIEVITAADIEKMGAESLKDIANNIPGLNVQYGTFPSASSLSKASLSIRGMSANGTLFLLDGRRLAGEVKNPYDLDRIPASQIERIEVVKGPMSSLYGADAVGGVINIITKQPNKDETKINFGVRYGQNSDGDGANTNVNFHLKGKAGKLKYSAYVNNTTTDPYTQKEDASVMVKAPKTLNPADGSKTYQKVKPSALATPTKPDGSALPVNTNTQGLLNGVAYIQGNLKDSYTDQDVTYREESEILTYGARIDYGVSDNTNIGLEVNSFTEERDGSYIGYFHPTKFSFPAYNVPVNSKDENERLDIGADVTTSLTNDLLLKLKLYRSYYEKRNTTTATYWKDMGYSSEADSASSGMNANATVQSVEGMLVYGVSNHLITAGAETREEKRDATVFECAEEMCVRKVDYKAFYVQDEIELGDDLNMIVGGRFDDVSNAENKATFRLGVVKNLADNMNLRANFAQGYRTPDIREMYIYKDTPNGKQRGADTVDTTVGKNSAYDLKPEFTNSYEVGISGRSAALSYSGAIFVNQIEDRIEQVNKGTYYTFENIDKAETKGVEASVKYTLNPQLVTSLNWTELQTEDKDTGKDLEFNPERTIAMNVNYKLNNSLDFGTTIKHIGEQYYTDDNGADQTTSTINTVDVIGNYKMNNSVAIYLGANNLTDEKIDDVLGSSVGTFYFVGTKVEF